jgi:hypothetical protein
VDKLIQSQKGAMNKFVLRNDNNQNFEQLYITNGEEQHDQFVCFRIFSGHVYVYDIINF